MFSFVAPSQFAADFRDEILERFFERTRRPPGDVTGANA
jgi:hypothetical protein